MSQSVSVRKKTVLLIRSSTLSHSLSLLRRLRQERHPDSETRWILILQPQVEAEFRRELAGVEVLAWIYDHDRFTFGILKKLFLEQMRSERIDTVYIPFNNPAGKGYFQILRFCAAAGIPKKFIHIAGDVIESITLKNYVIRRAKDLIPDVIENVIFVLVLPFALIIQIWRSFRLGFRN